MLYIKSAFEMVSIDISEGMAIMCTLDTDASWDSEVGNLIIKTPKMCYTFKGVDDPDVFADILGDRIIEERQKDDIIVDMNILVEMEPKVDSEFLEFIPESIEIQRI